MDSLEGRGRRARVSQAGYVHVVHTTSVENNELKRKINDQKQEQDDGKQKKGGATVLIQNGLQLFYVERSTALMEKLHNDIIKLCCY